MSSVICTSLTSPVFPWPLCIVPWHLFRSKEMPSDVARNHVCSNAVAAGDGRTQICAPALPPMPNSIHCQLSEARSCQLLIMCSPVQVSSATTLLASALLPSAASTEECLGLLRVPQFASLRENPAQLYRYLGLSILQISLAPTCEQGQVCTLTLLTLLPVQRD